MKANKVMISGKYQDDELQQLLDGQGLFMFAEAAINEAVPSLAEKWGGSLEQTRLYWGETGKLHSTISPYLIPVHRQNWPELQRLIIHQPGWGLLLQLDWFMLAYTPLQQLQALLAHLRQWSWITTPEHETAILRLSDWQVVKPLLLKPLRCLVPWPPSLICHRRGVLSISSLLTGSNMTSPGMHRNSYHPYSGLH